MNIAIRKLLVSLLCSGVMHCTSQIANVSAFENLFITDENPSISVNMNIKSPISENTVNFNILGNQDKYINLKWYTDQFAATPAKVGAIFNESQGTVEFESDYISYNGIKDGDFHIVRDVYDNEIGIGNNGDLKFRDCLKLKNVGILNTGKLYCAKSIFVDNGRVLNGPRGEIFANSINIKNINRNTAISNTGEIIIDGDLNIYDDKYKPKKEENIRGIINAGTMLINDGLVISDCRNIVNEGTMTINRRMFIGSIDDNDYYFFTALDNSGVLNINLNKKESFNYILGNIKHNAGAKTHIIMGFLGDTVGFSGFLGNIIGADKNFRLELMNTRVCWAPYNQKGSVEGIILNAGSIMLHSKRAEISKQIIPWGEGYDLLKLKNFKLGSNTNSGRSFCFTTDLKVGQGDSIKLEGEPCSGDIVVEILNKDNNNGLPLEKEYGEGVTIITAPIDTELNVKGKLAFFNTDKKYTHTPNIVEVVEGKVKKWVFVGWDAI